MDNTLLCAIHRERDNVEMKELKEEIAKIITEIITLIKENITRSVLCCLFAKSVCVIFGIDFNIWYGVFVTFLYVLLINWSIPYD